MLSRSLQLWGRRRLCSGSALRWPHTEPSKDHSVLTVRAESSTEPTADVTTGMLHASSWSFPRSTRPLLAPKRRKQVSSPSRQKATVGGKGNKKTTSVRGSLQRSKTTTDKRKIQNDDRRGGGKRDEKTMQSTAPSAQPTTPSTAARTVDSDFEFGEDVGGDAVMTVEGDSVGVVRMVPADPEEEFTALGRAVKKENRRKGQPEQRQNSRSIKRTDRSVSAEEAEKEALEYAQRMKAEEELSFTMPGGGGEAHGAGATQLPFDSQYMAETILEADVEGLLDETWQDHRTAHAEDVEAIVEMLRTVKVRDIVAINAKEKTYSFDYIVFGTCESARHINLAAWTVQDADTDRSAVKIKKQAKSSDLWLAMPMGRIVINLMVESFREVHNFERKWAVSGSMDPLQFAHSAVSEGRSTGSHGLWTLTMNLQDLEDHEVDYCKEYLIAQRM